MKKAGLFLVLLLYGYVFAQAAGPTGLELSGSVDTGLGLTTNSGMDNGGLLFKAAGRDSGRPVGQARLNAAYTTQTGDAGAKLRLQWRDGNPFITLGYAYGWFNAFDSMLYAAGGMVNDGVFDIDDPLFDDDNGEGLGGLFIVKPLDNSILDLRLGTGVYVGVMYKYTEDVIDTDDIELEMVDYNISNITGLSPEDMKYTANLRLRLKNEFCFYASWRNESLITGPVNDRDEVSMRVYAGLEALFYKPLTLTLLGVFDEINDFEGKGSAGLYLNINYQFDSPLTVGLHYNCMYNNYPYNIKTYPLEKANNFNALNPDGNRTAHGLWLWASYGFGKKQNLIARADLVFVNGGQMETRISKSGKQNEYELNRWHYQFYRSTYDYNPDHWLFSFRPSFIYKLGKNQSFEIGDLAVWSFDKTSRINIRNVIYFGFTFGF
jgi:hypothetical protein